MFVRLRHNVKLRFSLRTILLITSVCAVLCGTIVPPLIERVRMQRLVRTGVQIYTEPRGQFFLRHLFGDGLFERVVYIHLDDPNIDDNWLEHLKQFPYAEVVSIKSSKITDAGLARLAGLPKLLSLNLVDTKVTSDGIASLRNSSRSLCRVEATTSIP